MNRTFLAVLVLVFGATAACAYDYVDKRGYRHWNHYGDPLRPANAHRPSRTSRERSHEHLARLEHRPSNLKPAAVLRPPRSAAASSQAPPPQPATALPLANAAALPAVDLAAKAPPPAWAGSLVPLQPEN